MQKLLRLAAPAGWMLLFLLLPITSLPWLSSLLGNSMVAAPSSVILLLLVLFWMLPALWKRAGFPPQTKPLLAFAAIALLASLFSFFSYLPAFKSGSDLKNLLEGILTLGTGVCFYLVTATWFSDEKRLRSALRWINWSGLILIGWSLAQALYAYERYPDWMVQIQRAISASGRLFPLRVTGLAFEPSWLAHQLNMLYLPFWLAATVKGTTAHGWRIWKISFENLLLPAGLAILWLSSSRVGLLAFLLTLAYLFYLLNVRAVGFISRKVQGKRAVSKLKHRLILGAVILAFLVLYAALFFGTAYALSQFDPRMASMFNFSAISEKGILAYANQLLFAERLVYWDVGWKVFNDYPLFGVGLGNVGYFFPDKVNSFGWGLVEIHGVVLRASGLPNVKALWARLPAETGLVGLALFLAWLYILWVTNNHTSRHAPRSLQSIGLAGQLALVALLVEGFSVDTFALPYYWIAFGLATAAWRVFRDNHLPKAKDIIESDCLPELTARHEEKC